MDIRILFLTGNSKEALLDSIVREGHAIEAVVVPKSKKYESNYEKVVSTARACNLKVVVADPKKLSEATSKLNYNVLFSCGYPFLIPKEVYSRPRYAVNFHPSLLPKHRGKYVCYILVNRDEESGVTAHLIDDRLDAGPIILQKRFKVSPFDTVKSLLRKSAEAEVDLVRTVIKLIRTEKVEAHPQDESKASTHVRPRTPEDSEVDPNKPLKDLFYEIRAYDPADYPAFFYVNGQRVFIHLFRKEKPEDEADLL